MAEGTDGAAGRQGSPADRKTTTGQVTLIGASAAGGAATILYIVGCLKGHQFYPPDDALALFWAGLLAPAAKVLYEKFNKWAGVPGS